MKSKYLLACPFLADQSETHKTVEQGDDFEPQVVIKKHQCAVKNIYIRLKKKAMQIWPNSNTDRTLDVVFSRFSYFSFTKTQRGTRVTYCF